MPRRRRVIEQIEDLAQQIYQRQILPARRIEAELEGPVRRKVQMPRRSVRATSSSKKKYGDPVFVWAFRSSQPRGGQFITYETRLEEDGVVRCNCPGWIFCKGEPAQKTCKHKNQIVSETSDILARFRRGETLPTFHDENPVTTQQTSTSTRISPSPEASRIRHGRVITFDL